MVRAKGYYRDGKIELDGRLELPEGSAVEVTVQPVSEPTDDDWRELGMDRLEAVWDNDQDAVYDNWRRLYGLQVP